MYVGNVKKLIKKIEENASNFDSRFKDLQYQIDKIEKNKLLVEDIET